MQSVAFRFQGLRPFLDYFRCNFQVKLEPVDAFPESKGLIWYKMRRKRGLILPEPIPNQSGSFGVDVFGDENTHDRKRAIVVPGRASLTLNRFGMNY